ncbi:hypothetical protein [Halomonas sp. PR-M31]|uniref:hypothetical protein n=1 Tax=Halomonas sp. PR-M31 TaxID=1471202 RepID=UPI0006521494|nr:hypothetical protein [Halomonas sp. PR-M31]
MKTRLLLSALLVVSFPMMAAASDVTARINKEIQEPLSPKVTQNSVSIKNVENTLGKSAALTQLTVYISETTEKSTMHPMMAENKPAASKPLDW